MTNTKLIKTYDRELQRLQVELQRLRKKHNVTGSLPVEPGHVAYASEQAIVARCYELVRLKHAERTEL